MCFVQVVTIKYSMSGLPICFYCKHKNKGQLKCSAFGNKLIPDEILFEKNDHTKPLPEQKNKFIFEPVEYFIEMRRSLEI